MGKRLAVVCGTCSDAVIASCESSSPAILAVLMIACHAAPPHNGHALRSTILDGEPPSFIDARLRVRCLHAHCGNAAAIDYRVPVYAIAAAVIAYHAQHEGHPLELHLDGRKIHPPEA